MKHILLALLLTGCGAYEHKDCYAYGQDCPRGPQGEPGDSGATGPQGVAGVGQPGAQGGVGQPGPTGANGPAGEPGVRGVDGVDGGVGPIGEQGPTGPTGPQGSVGAPGAVGPASSPAIIEVIDPCGPNPHGVDERLFRLSTGELVAWYEDVGLVALADGTYRTTDSQKCRFTVTNGEVTWDTH